MGTFVNDSGVIIASYNNEVIRFEKDGLQIFTDNKNVVIVSIQQNQRIERRYPASAISSPSNSGADDLKRKLFLMLEDYGAGGGDGVTDLQGAYDGGNVVNDGDVIIDGVERIYAIGAGVLSGGSGNDKVAFGNAAAAGGSGSRVNALGNGAMVNGGSSDINAFGNAACEDNGNAADNVNAMGFQAGKSNQTPHSNFFGRNAGNGNNTSFGVTVFSPESIPSYANKGAAETALTVANGCVVGQIYLFRNEANDNIGFIIPSA
jgi:hypothetical protein